MTITDIRRDVEWLRGHARAYSGKDLYVTEIIQRTFLAIADRHEALGAEVERLRVENDGYASGFDTQHAEIERLRAVLRRYEAQE